MSRLKYEDIKTIPSTMEVFDDELNMKVGYSLKELAKSAAETGKSFNTEKMEQDIVVGIVPVTAGKGCIRGFPEALMSIARHIGFRAVITDLTDTSGFAEAIDSGCTILLMADDDSFIAYNCRTGVLVNNNAATAYGFVTALEYMAGGLAGKEVLILGAGPIGRLSMQTVLEKGGRAGLYDTDRERAEQAANEIGTAVNPDGKLKIEDDAKSALRMYKNIIDATPAANIIEESDVSEKTVVVAPGVPHGLTEGAVHRMGKRFLHDNLRIGTAAMLIRAVLDDSKEVL